MGLSATPWNPGDKESESILKSYYVDEVYTYSLQQALDDDRLCQYTYNIHEVELNADEVYFEDLCAIVKVQNITIIVSKRRRPFHYLSDFDNLRLNLQDYRLLVVKSGYLSPDLQGLSCPSFMALSNGAVKQDLKNIDNYHRKRPTFPFQEFNEFIPRVSDGLNLLS